MIRGVYLNGVKITDEERNKEAFEELKSLLTKLIYASRQKRVGVDLVTDYLSLIIKAPLLLPYVPYRGGLLINNFDYLTSYIALRRNVYIADGEELLEIPKQRAREFLETIYGGKLEAYYSIRKIFEALSTTPADTRPGLNIAPLSSHLTLTSLVTWLEQPHSTDLPYLRLGAILHDIGKLVSPTHHVEAGTRFMSEVIAELRKENVDVEDLENALDKIKEHHSEGYDIVKRADETASSIDRLINEVKEVASKIEECKPFLKCYEQGVRAECMEEVKYSEEEYAKCTEKIYDAMQKKGKAEEEEKATQVKGYLYFIDFPGVQSFINYFPSLRDLSAASFFVDFLISTVPFLYLDILHRPKTFLPPEALLSVSGGHSYLIGRADVKPEDFIKRLEGDKIFQELDVKLKVSYVPFYYDGKVIKYNSLADVIRRTNLNSLLLRFNEEVLSYGLHKVCDSCGIRPAVHSENGMAYCRRCYFVHKNSGSRGAMAKLSSEFLVLGDRGWSYSKVDDPMEAIAGERGYVSLIKFDGNSAGEYFKRSLTFGEYSAKSFWVDYAVKKAYFEALKELGEEAKMIPVGTLFLGGDEGAIITPSEVSLPFVYSFIKRAEESGLTFKVGVVTAKYDHPVQFLLNSAEKLMEESKEEGKSTVGVLTTSAFLTDKVVEKELEEFREIYSPKMSLEEVGKLISIANNLRKKGKLKHAISGLNEALELYFTSGNNLLKLLAYLVRERQRVEDNDEKELYTLILKTYKEGFVNLLGYYHVLKTFVLGEKE